MNTIHPSLTKEISRLLTATQSLKTDHEDHAVVRLLAEMVAHVLADKSLRQSVRNTLTERVRRRDIPKSRELQKRPLCAVPPDKDDQFAPYKPLPFRDGLRKGGVQVDLADPAVVDDHEDLTDEEGFTYNTQLGAVFVNGPSATDVNQGSVGDCYFMATLAAIAQTNPDFIKQNVQANPDGTYSVRFFHLTNPTHDVCYDEHGSYIPYVRETMTYNVDAELPKYSSSLMYGSGTSSLELWVPLYEKAYAVMNANSYQEIEGGTPATAFSKITGLTATDITHAKYGDGNLFVLLKTVFGNNCPMVAGSNQSSDGSSASSTGIVYGHAYTIVGVSDATGTKIITLRNPWGHQEWRGTGADTTDDGTFSMPFADFLENFSYTSYVDGSKYDGLFNANAHPKLRL